MSKHMACGDIVPGCRFEASADDEGELMTIVARHAADKHGVEQMTPELAEKVKAAIHEKRRHT